MNKALSRLSVYVNAGILVVFSLYFAFIPAVTIALDLNDSGLRDGRIPRFAFRWHRDLSDRFAVWASTRVASGQAAALSTQNISGTEWPVFSSVYYLWATEALQDAWEQDPTLSPEPPNQYAQKAIRAAAELVSDPNHAAWVKDHWGSDYLHTQNLFYRMLLISGLTSYEKLSGDGQYRDLLVDQVETLSQELDASPYGLLDDYPDQCYPIDIVPAIAAIKRADSLLGTDHSDFVDRAVRGFDGERLDPVTGLPPFRADSGTGRPLGPARGVSVFMLTWAPEIWPETAREWYARFGEQFWQRGIVLAGYREFARDYKGRTFLFDVDAGPVIFNYGTSASAFGIGAARANGRLDQAYPLSAEALVAAWPLPDGTLLGARVLSNQTDAPYTGETALLYSFTRQPVSADITPGKGLLPLIVYFAFLVYIVGGLFFLLMARYVVRRWNDIEPRVSVPAADWQFLLWAVLILAGVTMVLFVHTGAGFACLLAALFLPRTKQTVF